MRRPRETDQFELTGVAERLASYEISVEDAPGDAVDGELVEKAATLLAVMPPHQRRSTIEELVAPDDPRLGRRVVDTLIGAGFATEDEVGRLHRSGASAN